MKRFSTLFTTLDTSTSTNDKLEALTAYFSIAPPEDAAWASYFLAGGKPRQTVSSRILIQLACRASGLSEWLFEESYHSVGDLAETIAHILPPAQSHSDLGLAQWIQTRLLPLRQANIDELQTRLLSYWDELDWGERFLLTKLIAGGFRVGVARQLVVRALAKVAGVDHKYIAQRMMGWTDSRQVPSTARYQSLISAPHEGHSVLESELGLPYPFFLAHPLQTDISLLGLSSNWLAEWKWDGIRAQLVKRGGRMWLWSRGEDLITDRFPELISLGAGLPDGCVIDGELLAWKPHSEVALPFACLQPRITRKTLTKKILAEFPVSFLAYDLLEIHGQDLRMTPLIARRQQLEALALSLKQTLAIDLLRLSPLIEAPSWEALMNYRNESRNRGVEGLMLKARDSLYGVGRTKAVGTWWKWKIDPYAIDAVLLYAQSGHGRRANLYTDFTFAVWDEVNETRTLVPFTKAYSGLTDQEMHQVDAIVRKTTVEKFGPVRSLKPTLVFEIGFEGIQRSARHKSGIAVRFPRMLRWRTDKPVEEADTLELLKGFLNEGVG